MIIKQNFLPKEHVARPGLPLNNPTSVTIHCIGPYPGQAVDTIHTWWLKASDKSVIESAHFVLKDTKVVQYIPEQEIAYHCGDRKGNSSSLSIMIIPMNIAGQFSQDSIDTLRKLLAKLPKLPIKRHYDWNKQYCPSWYTAVTMYGDAHWIELLKELQEDG